MSDIDTKQSGRCLCGAVGVDVETINTEVGVCHCNMCRKWSGGPFFAIDCGNSVTFEGEGNISTYSSSEWAERGFCKQCGTHLYYRLKETSQYIMAAGIFSDEALVLDHQVFIDEKPPYYEFANKTKNLTGAEVFAMFAPPDSDN